MSFELGRFAPLNPTFAELSRLSDEEVMVHLQAGVDDALAVLLLRYHRLILSISVKILMDPGEAEDCAQSIFFELFRSAGQFDPARGTTKVWLLQCTYHRAINRKRYLRIRRFYDVPEAGDVVSLAQAPETSSASVFAGIEARKMLGKAMDSLTASQRKTLELTYFEGLTLREIAERLGEPLGNVRHHYYRGLERLRTRMTQEPNRSEKRDSVSGGVIDAEA
jgi:RNA polymerase sigma-70 factor (ECF subfamily)